MSALKFPTFLIFVLIILHATKASNSQSEKNRPRKGQGRPPSRGRSDIIEITSSSLSVNEGDRYVNVNVRRTNASARAVRVRVNVVDGSAILGKDYVCPRCQVLKFRPRESQRVVRCKIIDDKIWEPVKIFTVRLCKPKGGAVFGQRSYSTVAICDNDDPPTITTSRSDSIDFIQFLLQEVVVSEAHQHVRLWLVRTLKSHEAHVKLSTKDETAVADEDYQAALIPLVVTFEVGQLMSFIDIPIINNNVKEYCETFLVHLWPPVGGQSGALSNCRVHIVDDDGPISTSGTNDAKFFIPDVSVHESQNCFHLTVIRTPVSFKPAQVRLSTKDGTALDGKDYRGISKPILVPFNPGQVVVYVTIHIINNNKHDGSKEFYVHLSNPKGADLGHDSDATVTIIDDEDPDKCSLKPETGPCRAAMTRYYYDPETNTCKKFSYGGCGGNGNKFETEKQCLNECSTSPPEEPVVIDFNLSAVPVTEEINDFVYVPVKTDRGSNKQVSVNWGVRDGTAKWGEDYAGHRYGNLIFRPKETQKYIYIPVIADEIRELTEEFYVDLLSTTGDAILGKNKTACVSIRENP